MVANNFKNYDLSIGQIINIPNVKYIVQSGDTLFKISQKYNISLFSLRQANNIWTNYIYVGQVLEIPLSAAEIKEEPITPIVKEPEIVKEPVIEKPVVEETVVEQPKESSQNYTAEELDLLARLIMAETESQPYEAKVAVGSVVMNRVKSGLFAPTISGVINQNINGYYQFTPVENGWINRPANEDSIKAARYNKRCIVLL